PLRQAIVAIHPATFHASPDWPEGPLPFTHAGITADTASRSTYYPHRTARLLYGTPGHPRRWHKILRYKIGGLTVLGVEALCLSDQPDADGLVMIHLDANRSDILTILRALARRSTRVLNRYDPDELLDDHVRLSSAAPFTVAFVTPRRRHLSRLYA